MVDASLAYVRAQYPNLSKGADRVGGQAEIKSAPSVASPNLAEFGGRCRKAMLGV